MFGMGGSEIIVILIIALLFLGPDKLPEATKAISKGIRELKKGSRVLTQTIENDETVGGALRDLKSALRGEDPIPRPKPLKRKPPPMLEEGDVVIENSIAGSGPEAAEAKIEATADEAHAKIDATADAAEAKIEATAGEAHAKIDATADAAEAKLAGNGDAKALRMSDTAGEAEPVDGEVKNAGEELAALIRPAEGTIAKGSETKHG